MECVVKDKPGVRMFRSVGHRIYIRGNGALLIRSLDGAVAFAKVGADGRGVEA